ncbi:MAG TPA: C4-type zinc ribbon domain-containing protein [Planctomycetota bacterium]|nr:C4-type zinc ribbon domain-containing protein [Planctomycetota bacterium]
MKENSNLQNLRILHGLDCKLIALRKKHGELPSALQRLEQAVQEKDKALHEAEGHLKALRSHYDQKELSLKSFEADVQKFRSQLNQVKTNKEYSAVISEITTKQADISKLEDEMLLEMDIVERQQHVIQECKAAKKAAEDELNAHKDEIRGQQQEVDKQLAVLAEERKQLAANVPDFLLHQYERILAKRGPTAIVPVVDLSCQGCFMKITPEVQAQLLKNEQIIYCKTCSRIMYME